MVFGHGPSVELHAGQPAARAELDGDDVDAPVGLGLVDLFEVCPGRGDEVSALRSSDCFLRQAEGASAAGLDLDKDEGIAVSCDDVDLALAGPVVGREDGVAELLEVEARGGLPCAGGADVVRPGDGRYSPFRGRPRMSLTGLKVRRWMAVGPMRRRASRWARVA